MSGRPLTRLHASTGGGGALMSSSNYLLMANNLAPQDSKRILMERASYKGEMDAQIGNYKIVVGLEVCNSRSTLNPAVSSCNINTATSELLQPTVALQH